MEAGLEPGRIERMDPLDGSQAKPARVVEQVGLDRQHSGKPEVRGQEGEGGTVGREPFHGIEVDEDRDAPAGGRGEGSNDGEQAAAFEQDLAVAEVESLVQRRAIANRGQHHTHHPGRSHGHSSAVLVLTASAPLCRAASRCAGSVTKPPTMMGSGNRDRISLTTRGKITPGRTSTMLGRA